MNVYSELWELLSPNRGGTSPVCFGTLSAVEPLTVTVGGTDITNGLSFSRGTVFYKEQIGRRLALLPCEEGFLILFQVEGGNT
jgi:hypothetical protein